MATTPAPAFPIDDLVTCANQVTLEYVPMGEPPVKQSLSAEPTTFRRVRAAQETGTMARNDRSLSKRGQPSADQPI